MTEGQRPVSTRSMLRDALVLSALVLLSVLPYLRELGFYSDDWAFLGNFRVSGEESSLLGLYRAAVSPVHAMRPLFVLYLAGMYRLYGLNPLGYHLTNAVVLAAGVVLLYLVLRELGLRRSTGFAVAAVYATLPHYSTGRFWVVALPIVLSMTLYLLSLYAGLRAVRERVSWSWEGLKMVSLLGSLLAYEIFLPLFLLNVLLVADRLRRMRQAGARLGRGTVAALLGGDLIAVAGVALFKLWTTQRLHPVDPAWHVRWFGRLLCDSLFISFGRYGWELPRRLARPLAERLDGADLLAAAGIGLLVAVWLYRAAADLKAGSAPWRHGLAAIGAGLLVFFLGYAIFLTNTNAYATATGIANRIAIASALGVALVFVGGFRLLSGCLPAGRPRRAAYALAVALLCAGGSLAISALASYWTAAYDREQQILAAIRNRFPTLPPGSTLILDGVCPYVGPAIVFESNWDLAGALWVHYKDSSLRADVVTPNLNVEAEGLTTVIYGSSFSHYPYGERLLVYDPGREDVHPLPTAAAARAWLDARPDLSRGCPAGSAGYGVPIF